MKNNKTLYIVIGILLALLFISGYNKVTSKRNYTRAYNLLSDSLFNMQQKVTKAGKTIQYQKQVVATKEEAIQAGFIKISELKDLSIKELKVKLALIEKIEVLEKRVPYVNPTIIYVDSGSTFDQGSYVKVPVPFYDSAEFLVIDGSVTMDGLELDKLVVNSNPTIYIGNRKEKGIFALFKKPIPEVVYTNKNPYVKLTSMQNIIIEERRKRWYQTNIFKYTVGVVGGGLIVNSLK